MPIFPAAIIAGSIFTAIAGAVISRGQRRIAEGRARLSAQPYDAEKRTVRLPVQPARYVWGERRIAGSLVYFKDSGKSQWQVYALSKGECESIESLWVDGKRQELKEITRSHTDADGTFTSAQLEVVGGKYENQITIYPMLKADGDTSGAGARLLRSVAGDGWTLSEAGIGIAYCIVELTQTEKNNEGVFSGVPKLDFLLRGRKFIHPSSKNFANWGVANPDYDDTKDESDTNPKLLPQPVPEWTDNAAAVIYDWLRVRRGIPFDEINNQSFQDAFKICEEQVPNSRPDDRYLDWDETSKRYAINCAVPADEPPEKTRAEMAFATRGDIFEHNTEFHIHVGHERTPTTVIWDGDILEGSIDLTPSISERVNAATMDVSQSKHHEYETYSSPQIGDPFQIARDGEVSEKRLGTRTMVTDPASLDRLIYGELQDSRAAAVLTLTLDPGRMMKWMAMKPTELCSITFNELGLSNFWGELDSIKLNDDLSVTCTFREIFAGQFSDTLGQGNIENRAITTPREDDPPEAIAANDITAVVSPRAGGSGSILWKVQVTVPPSSLTFAARVTVGDLELTNSTSDNFLEFDIDLYREDMTVTVWRVSRRDLAGPTTSKDIVPEYSSLLIPQMKLSGIPTELVGDVIINVIDPNTPVVKGAQFRFNFEPLDSASFPGAITEETWFSSTILDSQTLLFQPNSDPIFKLKFAESAKVAVYGRFVDSHGRFGPVSFLFRTNIVIPETKAIRFGGPPDWNGVLNHLGVFQFDSDNVLVPIPDAAPNAITAQQWDGFSGDSEGPDGYKARWRAKGASDWGTPVDISGSAAAYTISGLTNDVVYEAQLWRVDGSVEGAKTTIDFKPTRLPVAPSQPRVSGTGRVRSIQIHSVVDEEDERARVQRHEYKIATSESAVGGAAEKIVAGSADHDVTFLIPGLVATTTYYVQVRAVNSAGNGPWSPTATIRTGGDISASSWTRSAWSYDLYPNRRGGVRPQGHSDALRPGRRRDSPPVPVIQHRRLGPGRDPLLRRR